MSRDGAERVVLINCTDEEEIIEERERPNRCTVICCRVIIICYYLISPIIFLIRVLDLILKCFHNCCSDCCCSCCKECMRGIARALCGSCARGVRSLGRFGRQFCSICTETCQSFKFAAESWRDV